MSEELLAKVVSERNALKAKVAGLQVKLSAEKDERARDVGDLKQKLAEAEKLEFEARVDAQTWKADLSRVTAQKNLALKKLTELEAEIARLKRLVPTDGTD